MAAVQRGGDVHGDWASVGQARWLDLRCSGEHVRIAFTGSGETYGAPRVHQELRAAGLPTSTKRGARLMRKAGLAAGPRTRRRIVTADSQHGDPIAPNRLARAFDVHGVALNQVWVGDITYLPTREASCIWRRCWTLARHAASGGRCATRWKWTW